MGAQLLVHGVFDQGMVSMGSFTKILSNILTLLGIAFFLYAAYQGVVGGGGSTSVFTGVGALIAVLLGSYLIDKLVQD